MAMRFIDGFDHYSFSPTAKKKWDDGSSYASSSPGRFGVGGKVRPSGSGNLFTLIWTGMTKTIDPGGVSKLITGGAVRFDSSAASIGTESGHPFFGGFGHPFLAIRGDNDKHQVQFFVEPGTGRIRAGLANGSWPVGNSSTNPSAFEPLWYPDSDFVPPFGLWFYFEVVVDAAGSLIAYADSEEILNVSDTTLVSGATGYTGVRWMGMDQFGSGYDLDDTYIADGSGSHVNDAIGEIRVEWRTTNGEGDTNDWIPSIGTDNSANVDGTTAFTEIGDPNQYNRSDVVGATDLYHHEDFSRDGTIYGVQVNLAARKDDVGNRKVKPLLRVNSTTYEGAEVKLFSDYVYVGQMWPQNPNTSTDWTRTAVNAAQSGIRIST